MQCTLSTNICSLFVDILTKKKENLAKVWKYLSFLFRRVFSSQCTTAADFAKSKYTVINNKFARMEEATVGGRKFQCRSTESYTIQRKPVGLNERCKTGTNRKVCPVCTF